MALYKYVYYYYYSAVFLKPNIEVTSSTRYLCENFLSYDILDRAYIIGCFTLGLHGDDYE